MSNEKEMSDSDSDAIEDALSAKNMRRISDEIKRRKKDPATRGMFVSGWDDDAEGIEEEENPHGVIVDRRRSIFDCRLSIADDPSC